MPVRIRNIRRTLNLLTFVVYPLGGFLLAALGVFHWVLALLIFPWLFVMGLLTTRIRCPGCDTPVGWHKYRLFGFDFEGWSPFTPGRCEWCGHDLTRRESTGPDSR